jgi:hypothetical protein
MAERPGPKDMNALRDAEMWERMADWEEKNPPAPT